MFLLLWQENSWVFYHQSLWSTKAKFYKPILLHIICTPRFELYLLYEKYFTLKNCVRCCLLNLFTLVFVSRASLLSHSNLFTNSSKSNLQYFITYLYNSPFCHTYTTFLFTFVNKRMLCRCRNRLNCTVISALGIRLQTACGGQVLESWIKLNLIHKHVMIGRDKSMFETHILLKRPQDPDHIRPGTVDSVSWWLCL